MKLDIENNTMNLNVFIMGHDFLFKMTIERPTFKLFYIVQ